MTKEKKILLEYLLKEYKKQKKDILKEEIESEYISLILKHSKDIMMKAKNIIDNYLKNFKIFEFDINVVRQYGSKSYKLKDTGFFEPALLKKKINGGNPNIQDKEILTKIKMIYQNLKAFEIYQIDTISIMTLEKNIEKFGHANIKYSIPRLINNGQYSKSEKIFEVKNIDEVKEFMAIWQHQVLQAIKSLAVNTLLIYTKLRK